MPMPQRACSGGIFGDHHPRPHRHNVPCRIAVIPFFWPKCRSAHRKRIKREIRRWFHPFLTVIDTCKTVAMLTHTKYGTCATVSHR